MGSVDNHLDMNTWTSQSRWCRSDHRYWVPSCRIRWYLNQNKVIAHVKVTFTLSVNIDRYIFRLYAFRVRVFFLTIQFDTDVNKKLFWSHLLYFKLSLILMKDVSVNSNTCYYMIHEAVTNIKCERTLRGLHMTLLPEISPTLIIVLQGSF